MNHDRISWRAVVSVWSEELPPNSWCFQLRNDDDQVMTAAYINRKYINCSNIGPTRVSIVIIVMVCRAIEKMISWRSLADVKISEHQWYVVPHWPPPRGPTTINQQMDALQSETLCQPIDVRLSAETGYASMVKNVSMVVWCDGQPGRSFAKLCDQIVTLLEPCSWKEMATVNDSILAAPHQLTEFVLDFMPTNPMRDVFASAWIYMTSNYTKFQIATFGSLLVHEVLLLYACHFTIIVLRDSSHRSLASPSSFIQAWDWHCQNAKVVAE